MDNPWIELIENWNKNGRFSVSPDQPVIDRFNSNSFRTPKSEDLFRIHDEVLPYPFTGNIKKASVILLATNPGFVEKEKDTLYSCESFHQEVRDNLMFNSEKFLNEDEKRREYSDYWHKRTRKLSEDVGDINKVLHGIALLQFFPYHSKRFRKISRKYFDNKEDSYLITQKFNFYLLEQAIENKKLIIITRGKRYWYEAVKKLSSYKKEEKRVLELKNYQQPYITRRNFAGEGDYDKVIEELKKL